MDHDTRLENLRSILSDIADAQVRMSLGIEAFQREALLFLDERHRPAKDHPKVDARTFSVVWHGQRCWLGHTKSFELAARLLIHLDRYVPYDQLLRDVWHGDRRAF